MTSPTAVPVFGRRTETVKRVPFTLLSYKGDDEVEHHLVARAAIDASTALQANDRNDAVAARAIKNLLLRVLVDDDGVPNDAQPRQLGGGPDPADEDDDDTGSDVVVYGTDDDTSSAAWVLGDDDSETFPSASLALAHAQTNGSSLRRFSDLMDDPRHWVEISALRGIVRYLSKEAGNRPTKPSSGSSPRRTAKRRR